MEQPQWSSRFHRGITPNACLASFLKKAPATALFACAVVFRYRRGCTKCRVIFRRRSSLSARHFSFHTPKLCFGTWDSILPGQKLWIFSCRSAEGSASKGTTRRRESPTVRFRRRFRDSKEASSLTRPLFRL